jgi:hypothetical protein
MKIKKNKEPGIKILQRIKENLNKRNSSFHSDGPSYNDHSGDDGHSKAAP